MPMDVQCPCQWKAEAFCSLSHVHLSKITLLGVFQPSFTVLWHSFKNVFFCEDYSLLLTIFNFRNLAQEIAELNCWSIHIEFNGWEDSTNVIAKIGSAEVTNPSKQMAILQMKKVFFFVCFTLYMDLFCGSWILWLYVDLVMNVELNILFVSYGCICFFNLSVWLLIWDVLVLDLALT